MTATAPKIGDNFTEVDRSNQWKVTKVHPNGTVDMNNGVCTIRKVDLNTKSYHVMTFGQNQFQPYNPPYPFYMEAKGMKDEQMKTIEEAEGWAKLLTQEGAEFKIVDLRNDMAVFSS